MDALTGIDELDRALRRVSEARSRDEAHEAICDLAEVAPRYIEALDVLYESNTYPRMPLIWCLIGQTSKPAFDLFSKAIKDRDQYTRWAAATALSRCRHRGASSLLVSALKDRSHLVKSKAVDAMALARFRDPAAIPQLKKIIASSYLQRVAPGMVRSAKKALRACQGARR